METTSPRARDDSYDEYDATLDADALLVDWTAVPLAIEPTISPTNTQAHTPENGISRRNSSPGTSDDYGEDDYEDSFLVQLTQLEANIQSEPTSLQFPLGNITYSTKESRPNAKRPRQSNLSDQSSPVSKRFKTGAPNLSPDAKARRIVKGYDEELTCPLCLDFFVATHVANPCGHSVCGPCIVEWVKTKNNNCPICRTKLTVACPSLPNFAMDSTIEKHIASLRQTGVSGWEAGGHLVQEREQRRSAWGASKRAGLPQNASVPRPFVPSPVLYGMYLATYPDFGTAPDEEGGLGNTSGDEDIGTGGGADEESSEADTGVPLQEHFIDLTRINSSPPRQSSHRGERNQSRGGRGRGNRHRNRRQHLSGSRNGRGRGGRTAEGH